MLPYLTYGLTAWGQKRALRMMHFLNLMLFLFLFLQKYYFKAILHSMYDSVSNNSAPEAISEKFVKTSSVHSYNTRASSCGKYHTKFSRLNQQRNSF